MPTQTRTTMLLATDQQQSVSKSLSASGPCSIAYTPYGHRPQSSGLLSQTGFNGELPDPLTGHYHLGKGYRQFNTVLMRFNSPDSWSPFGKGGLNAYTYCGGDPTNQMDPTGHNFVSFYKAVEKFLNLIGRTRAIARNAHGTGRALTSSPTSAILQSPPPVYRNPMANPAGTSYLKRPQTTINHEPVLPSYKEATASLPTSPPTYSLPDSPDFEMVWLSREPPPAYYKITPHPPPRYRSGQRESVRTGRIARPIGPPPVPDRPPETLLPRTSNARVRGNPE